MKRHGKTGETRLERICLKKMQFGNFVSKQSMVACGRLDPRWLAFEDDWHRQGLQYLSSPVESYRGSGSFKGF